jgi:thiol-disulfide isomerase/thioredoxin
LPSFRTTVRRSSAEISLALACALALGCSRNETPSRAKTEPAVTASEPAPLAPLDTVSAERLLAEVRRLGGKGTLVNAWASWCGPCKHELPMLEKLAKEYAAAGIHVVLVSLDEPTDREKAAAFLTEHKLALTSYLAERPLGPFKQGMNPRWPGMLPASFLYDSTGALRYFWGGEAFEEEVAPVLAAFAAGKRIEGEATPAVAPEGETH